MSLVLSEVAQEKLYFLPPGKGDSHIAGAVRTVLPRVGASEGLVPSASSLEPRKVTECSGQDLLPGARLGQ